VRKAVVIMFHSVGLDKHKWLSPRITEPIGTFDRKMAALRHKGFATTFFKDHVPGTASARREVVLTFDDGYLDNWVHVFPVLKRYGLKGTIFVNPEFVDPRDLVREQVDPVDADDAHHDATDCCAGFLSWPEMREMERSGLVDIQSHALTHTWYFKGPRIVDFWDPGAAVRRWGPIWMLWNEFPDFKPYYLTKAAEYETRIPYGSPIYEHGKSLATRRYFPGDGLDKVLPRHVAEHGGVEFFRRRDWRAALHAVADRHRERVGPEAAVGRLESDDDYLGRIRHELSESKRILEQNLEKTIDALCWPGGGVTDTVLETAREVGYRRFTLPSGSRAQLVEGNWSDLTPRGGGWTRIRYRGRDLGTPGAREFRWAVEGASGSLLHWSLVRGAVLLRLGWSYLKGG